jgi:hypothetical protein
MRQNYFNLYPISMNERSKHKLVKHMEQSKLHPTDKKKKKIDDTLSLIFVSFGKEYLSYIKFWFSDMSPFFISLSFFLSFFIFPCEQGDRS